MTTFECDALWPKFNIANFSCPAGETLRGRLSNSATGNAGGVLTGFVIWPWTIGDGSKGDLEVGLRLLGRPFNQALQMLYFGLSVSRELSIFRDSGENLRVLL